MRRYEALIVYDPSLDEPAIRAGVERLTKPIEEKGELLAIDEWGRRRLAYEIDHHREGYYVVVDFRSEADLVEELERLFRLGEEFLRGKIVRKPDLPGPTGGGEKAGPSPETSDTPAAVGEQ